MATVVEFSDVEDCEPVDERLTNHDIFNNEIIKELSLNNEIIKELSLNNEIIKELSLNNEIIKEEFM